MLFAFAALLLPLFAQTVDQAYSARIKEYTTEPFFLTELVDHLPASDRVPTPEKVLGYVIGAPNKLTYSADIHRYMRELEKTSPRVRVLSMGRSEEGRETILVVISDESNMKRLDRYREITGRLADPRKTPAGEARKLLEEGLPLYWIAGSIHSSECGSPEMLMELAYRLAVEETPFVQAIRRNSIVMITPVQEVDGHDRYVDLYNYKKANPGKAAPGLVYWGKYVAHDNNRDGMALSLALSRMMVKTFLEWHPQVLHDLHESQPFLYTSTGMGPYNAWLDPIVISEWQLLAQQEVEEMTKRGVPGVWTHGFYDGWAANYMMYIAQGRNATGRFYETYGGVGADTLEREVPETATTRTWFRPNPPLARVKWSIRNNINLQQSALLIALRYFADNRRLFLENFYLKSSRSVAKASNEGPAAWVIPADDPRPVECAGLVNLLQLHGVEVHRADGDIEITRKEGKEEKKDKYPRGSYVIRMDQPYSRQADMLLDTQYYSTRDPRPYDDTGWTLGPLRNVKTVRVTDAAILKAPMTLVAAPVKVEGRIAGAATAAYLIPHNTENALATFRFRLKDVEMFAAEAPFKALDREFGAGTFVIRAEGNPAGLRARIEEAARDLGLTVYASADVPKTAMHKLAAPRVALVHTWENTQNEGWFRIALDNLQIPYDYISTQVLRQTPDLRAKWDAILLGPASGSAQRIVHGIPMYGADPVPWKKSALTPNMGTSPDQTDDVRGGMGLEGMAHLARFIEQGGLFITIAGNASVPIDFGLIEGVSIVPARELQVRGSVVNAVVADKASPIAYGYGDRLAVYFNQSPVLQVSTTGRRGGGAEDEQPAQRTSGRGSATDPDIPQARPYTPPPARPELKPGEERPLTEEERESQRLYLFPEELKPRIVLRFAEEKDLWVSGMLAGGRELAHRPAVVDVPRGQGHVVLFANNPMWRQQTQGSFFLLFNALLNFDNLNAGRAK
jgi:hypothetical protein